MIDFSKEQEMETTIPLSDIADHLMDEKKAIEQKIFFYKSLNFVMGLKKLQQADVFKTQGITSLTIFRYECKDDYDAPKEDMYELSIVIMQGEEQISLSYDTTHPTYWYHDLYNNFAYYYVHENYMGAELLSSGLHRFDPQDEYLAEKILKTLIPDEVLKTYDYTKLSRTLTQNHHQLSKHKI